jgi:hypothetical protein
MSQSTHWANNHVDARVTRPVVSERINMKKLLAVSTLAITLGLLAAPVATAHAANDIKIGNQSQFVQHG